MAKSLSKLIVILGPTASGKSELVLKLAKKFDGEIVSADSRQIYEGMNIGTAKPPKNQESRIKNHEYTPRSRFKIYWYRGIAHYLVDIANPDKDFTLAQYKKLAIKVIRNIQKRGKVPFLVGGTGLYIKAVVDNFQIPKVKPNKKLRKKLEMLDMLKLQELLKKLDPDAIKFIDIKNKRRVLRAIEVSKITGKPFSSQRTIGKQIFDSLQIGIAVPKEKLQKKIDKRVERMFKMGLIKEVLNLRKYYSPALPSMNTIGYKEVNQYLNEAKTLITYGKSQGSDGMTRKTIPSNSVDIREIPSGIKELIKKNTFKYAKRQMTWFGKDKKIKWVDNYKRAEILVRGFITKPNKSYC